MIFCPLSWGKIKNCQFVYSQIEQTKESETQNKSRVNYELRIIYDSGPTIIPPWSILVLGDVEAYLAHRTHQEKRLSIKALTEENVRFIRNLWSALLENDTKLIYSKQQGFNDANIDELRRRESKYIIRKKLSLLDLRAIHA